MFFEYEAWQNVQKYTNQDYLSEEERIILEESLLGLVQIYMEKDIVDEFDASLSASAYNLAAYYETIKCYDLALKYYEISNDSFSKGHIGRIYYYGQAGAVNYEKAYQYFMETGVHAWLDSYLLADMYRYGQYVEQNQEKYEEMIEQLYEDAKTDHNVRHPIPEIFYRKAELEYQKGNKIYKRILRKARKMMHARFATSSKRDINEEDIRTLSKIEDLLKR